MWDGKFITLIQMQDLLVLYIFMYKHYQRYVKETPGCKEKRENWTKKREKGVLKRSMDQSKDALNGYLKLQIRLPHTHLALGHGGLKAISNISKKK